jgi:hypothetical protein
MDLVSAEISPHPLEGGRVRRTGKPTLCTGIEEEWSGNSLRHGSTLHGPKDDSIEEHHLFVRKPGECLPICIHDLVCALGRRVESQTLIEDIGNCCAKVYVAGACNAFCLAEGIRGQRESRSAFSSCVPGPLHRYSLTPGLHQTASPETHGANEAGQ